MKITDSIPASVDKYVLFFCRLGFAGLMRHAPGTWGTALACVLAPFIFMPFSLTVRAIILVALFFLGSIASDRAEKILGEKDPGQVVIDELVGVWVVLFPFRNASILLLIAAFLFFRVFDIFKPWPVKASESWLPGGFSVMLDDALAGIYAMICVGYMHWVGWI